MANPQIEKGYIRIANELWESLCRTHLDDHPRRVLGAIMRMTYGYRETRCSISLTSLSKMTCIDRANVSRAIRWLLASNMIGSVPGDTSKPTTYWVQKDYDKWRVVSHKTLVSQASKTSVSPDTTLVVVKDIKDKGVKKRGRPKKVEEEIPIPPELDTPKFREVWDQWKDFRKQKKKLTPRAIKMQFKFLCTLGVESAISSIETSMMNDYQGLFPPHGRGRRDPEPRGEPVYGTW